RGAEVGWVGPTTGDTRSLCLPSFCKRVLSQPCAEQHTAHTGLLLIGTNSYPSGTVPLTVYGGPPRLRAFSATGPSGQGRGGLRTPSLRSRPCDPWVL